MCFAKPGIGPAVVFVEQPNVVSSHGGSGNDPYVGRSFFAREILPCSVCSAKLESAVLSQSYDCRMTLGLYRNCSAVMLYFGESSERAVSIEP